MAMRWMAALSWRLPVRESRCRFGLPDHTGSGAVPLWRAKASLCLNRRTSATSATILAAVSGADTDEGEQVGRQGGDPLGDLALEGPFARR